VKIARSDWTLLQRDVDGETSPEERTALHRRLRAEPELRAAHERLLDVKRRLAGVRLVDPPVDLRRYVLRAVRRAPAPGEGGWRSWLAPLLARRPAFALASTLAVGVVGGVLLAGLLTGGPMPAVDESSVAGTVLPGGLPRELPVVDRLRLEGAGLRAEAHARREAGLVVAELVIEPPGAAEVILDAEGSGLRTRGFEAGDGLPPGGAILEPGGAYIAQAPPGRYRLVLAATGSGSGEIRIRLHSPDGQVDGRLQAGPVSVPAPSAPPSRGE